ncbi:MAG TPA: UDP-N-acetylmuramoyl-L-alanyl-D-glutamate--2,6-diaminopimelate ligase [Bacteroidia bacterium]|jgi:UDP-N-acetylmuramoyl-L-alanyl-D-glutamate--2,6-diaminopimelate ligase|nr:UDP-N-acetylmuramoyl-L-alanyl-D-glutamate--2,6-diaminopimelate ligase [Bacteroidia bacterium]
MKKLKDILYKVALVEVAGSTDVAVSVVHFDSRKVVDGTLFVAVKGTLTDGHKYIDQTIEKGAVAILCEDMPERRHDGITYVKVKDSSAALAIIAANYYDHPSAKLKLVGITGTNGKTTTATLLFNLFRGLGYKVGLLSTVRNQVNTQQFPATHTTPDSLELNRVLNEMVAAGCTHCFMEVSSHAIVQNRIAGISFTGGVFTNITHDHLDFHKTFDAYIKAKKKFFDELPSTSFALVNKDDANGMVMLQNTKASKKTFALKSSADFKCKVVENTLAGLVLTIDGRELWTKLIGAFNAYNLLGIYATAVLLSEEKEEVLKVLSALDPVEGRFQYAKSPNGTIGIVDYAHTPDALENVLSTLQEVRSENEKIITVVGCGGDRDRTKRPVMASIACGKSDKVILTSDNPRSEEPAEIIHEMEKGVDVLSKKKTISIVDRKEAIKAACQMAQKGDIILLAGKGHEKYQEVKGVKHPFDDMEILCETLNLFQS